MSTKGINPLANGISVSFICPECGSLEKTDLMGVPIPDWSAETSHDSEQSELFDHECSHCGTDFDINIYNAYYGGSVEMPDVEDFEVEEIFDEDDFDIDYELYGLSNPQNLDENLKECVYLLDSINTIKDPKIHDFLLRALYVGLIATLEAYLHALIRTWVFENPGNKSKFIQLYRPFQEQKCSIHEIEKTLASIDKRILDELNSHIYHKLPKIAPMFEKIVGVKFGDIGALVKAIEKRHHLVHRNGKDKDGNMVTVTEQEVRDLKEEVQNFIQNIQKQLIEQRDNAEKECAQ